MTFQLNSKAIVIAAVCTVLSANVSTAKASPFQSTLGDHLSSGTLILVQDTSASPQSETDFPVVDVESQLAETREATPEQGEAHRQEMQETVDQSINPK